MSEEIQHTLGKIEGKLDSLIETVQQGFTRINGRVDKAHERIGEVERRSGLLEQSDAKLDGAVNLGKWLIGLMGVSSAGLWLKNIWKP